MMSNDKLDKIVDICIKELKTGTGFMNHGLGLTVFINKINVTCIAFYYNKSVNIVKYDVVINKLKSKLEGFDLSHTEFAINSQDITAFEAYKGDDYFNPTEFRKFEMTELLEMFTNTK